MGKKYVKVFFLTSYATVQVFGKRRPPFCFETGYCVYLVYRRDEGLLGSERRWCTSPPMPVPVTPRILLFGESVELSTSVRYLEG